MWPSVCALCVSMLTAGGEPGLQPAQLYNGVGRPVMVTITAPPREQRSEEFITLAMMDVDGRPVDDPVTVQPGTIDLAQALPLIWEIRKACYVQALDGTKPLGSALVLQPMLTRQPPRTEQALRPDGKTPYTKIVGWGKLVKKEPSAPAAPAAPPKPAGNHSEEGKAAEPAPGNAPSAESRPVEEQIEPQIFSGLRIYVEQDVVLETSQGRIVLAMRPDEAPNTVWNFRQLVEGGFYEGIVFHRIVPFRREGTRFVIQAGDPTRTGDGDAGSWLPIEPSKLKHEFGVISMARDDNPDSAGSQFFIALSREGTQHLDGQYCAFGYAVDGADTINAIAGVELADVDAGKPRNPPMIEHAFLQPSPPRTPGKGRPDAKVIDETPVDPRPGRVPR